MASTTEQLDRSARLAKGQIRGVIPIQFFGEKFDIPNFFEGTLWDGPVDNYIFTDPALARINRISSDNTLDVGVQVQINGLDENWQFATQIVTLNGRNKVNLNPELIRINSAFSLSDLNGDVYIYEDGTITNGIPNNLNTVKGYIRLENNVTKAAVFSVPVNYIANFRQAHYFTIPTIQCCLGFRNMTKIFNGSIIKAFQAFIPSGGSTFLSFEPKTYFSVVEKTDLYVELTTSVGTGSSVSAVFDWELIKT